MEPLARTSRIWWRFQLPGLADCMISDYMLRLINDCLPAQVVQIFDSWAHHLSPQQFEQFSLPYAEQIVQQIACRHPGVPLIFHANGGEIAFFLLCIPCHEATQHGCQGARACASYMPAKHSVALQSASCA